MNLYYISKKIGFIKYYVTGAPFFVILSAKSNAKIFTSLEEANKMCCLIAKNYEFKLDNKLETTKKESVDGMVIEELVIKTVNEILPDLSRKNE